MDKKPQLAFIPLFVTAAAACGLLYLTFLDRWVAYVMFALCAIGAFDSATVGNLFVYMGLWLVPVILLNFGLKR